MPKEITTIGKFETEAERPAEPKYETLADVPPYVAVREASSPLASCEGYITWRTDANTVVTFDEHDDAIRPFLHTTSRPDQIRIAEVLGRITAIQFTKE
jgi:hypothetical protein